MKWIVSYFEQENTVQPAEVFEDELYRANPKFLGKLLYIHDQLKEYGHQLGGGYVEKCHNYQGLWEIRIIHSNKLVREFFSFDGERIVLLHGYVKSVGQPASNCREPPHRQRHDERARGQRDPPRASPWSASRFRRRGSARSFLRYYYWMWCRWM